MIRGVKLVGLPVRDQDVALKFYTEKLGFKVATDQPMGPGQRWIELLIPGSDVNIALHTPDGHESRIGGFQPITFWCDDVFATAEEMKTKGVELHAEPRKEIWGTMAMFKDPDGNVLLFSSR
jgi:catechol 2,3-dioxygenase-like lactoylglutathione lyase family enzyme